MFLPVCMNCMNIIWKKIDYVPCPDVCSMRTYGPDCEIVPDVCPHCGTVFESITMPTRLPFDTTEYLKGGIPFE